MSKKDQVVDLAIGVVALAVYLVTLAPTITWRNNGADSGDLVSAAFTAGIPHPTGYPLYTILSAIFSHLPFGEPAKNVGAFSSFAGAGAISLTSFVGRSLIPNSTPLAKWIPPFLALTFAFAPAFWSQATIAEVNSLAILLAAALIALLFFDSSHRLLYTAAIFGVGLTHHLTIVFLTPSAILLLTPMRWTKSKVAWAALALIAPLALYLYLPLRASAHPPISWGSPETLDGFLWVVTGAPYRPYLLDISPGEIFTRLALTARLLFDQFTVIGVALGLWGAAQMAMHSEANTRRRFLALLLAFVLFVAYSLIYASRDSFVYLLPAFLVFVLWMMYGVNDIATRLFRIQYTSSSAQQDGVGLRVRTALALVLVLFPLYNLSANFNIMNVSSDYAAYNYAKKIFAEIPRRAVIISDGDEHFFALEYYRYVVAQDQVQVVVVSAELLQYSWYFDQVRRVIPNVNPSPVAQPDRLIEVIDASLSQRLGVYTTVRNEWFLQYAMERREGYYRVLGRLP